MQIIAPLLVKIPKNKKKIHFQDFYIRAIEENEKQIFLTGRVADGFHRAEINKSEYCLATKIDGDGDYGSINDFQEAVRNFRKTLRLIGCKINLSIYSTSSKSFMFTGIHSQASEVNEAYVISNEKIRVIGEIYKRIKGLANDKKFEVIFQRYESALSINQFSLNSFVDAITVLESLLISSNRGELQIRLAIIVSNLLFIKFKESRKENFLKIKEYYGIRSDFVHEGKSKKYSNDKLENLLEIVRKILVLYVEDKTLFNEKKLEDLLIY